MQYNINGFYFSWEDGFSIRIDYCDNNVVIKANKEGLISLSKMLIEMASEQVPNGFHIHLDSYNALEDNSVETIFEKDISTWYHLAKKWRRISTFAPWILVKQK